MTVAGTVILLTDIFYNTTIIIKTGIREMLTRKMTLGKGHIQPSAMEKITETGITTNKMAGEFLQQFYNLFRIPFLVLQYACRKHQNIFFE